MFMVAARYHSQSEEHKEVCVHTPWQLCEALSPLIDPMELLNCKMADTFDPESRSSQGMHGFGPKLRHQSNLSIIYCFSNYIPYKCYI